MFDKTEKKGVQNMKNLTREYNILLESDTHFRDFVEQNKGKSIEKICEEFDINLDALSKFSKEEIM